MITDRIKALFNFIDFLHSNIENFMQYDEVVNELHLLAEQLSNYRAKSNFKEKLKYDEAQSKIAQKFDIIDKNIIQIIKSKVIEFNICDWNETNTLWNNNITDITDLTENFSEDDIEIIISNKNKYLEYRTVTKGEVFFGTGFFFSDLDQILKVLFDFFKESKINEFEAFETKTIQVNNIKEAVSLLNSKKDKPQRTKYNLFTFFEDLKNDWEFIQLNERLNTDAGIQTDLGIKLKDGTTANVYSAGMWYILTKDEYKNEGFVDAYCKGFEDGKQFINEKINKALNGFYKSSTKEYINELHYAYFFNAENYNLGYKNNACSYPINFYIDNIEKIGFAAGVVSTIDTMAKESPILFDGFYEVETDQPEAKKTKKTLLEFIHNIEDKEAFVQDLIKLFPTEIGKSIKAIIDILNNEKIIIYGTKEFKQLFEELTSCFGRDLGTYQSVQNVKTVDAETTNIVCKKLNPLIIKHKTI